MGLNPAIGARFRVLALPLILLALAFQLGAPAAAARMAAAMLDPFAAVDVCSPDKAKAPGQHGPAHHRDADCELCAACAPMLGTTAEAAQPRPPLTVALIVRSIRPDPTLPRGPPLRAPNARGPPLHA